MLYIVIPYLCSKNPMNGAIPVPGPIIIIGTRLSTGKENGLDKRANSGITTDGNIWDTLSSHPEQRPDL